MKTQKVRKMVWSICLILSNLVGWAQGGTFLMTDDPVSGVDLVNFVTVASYNNNTAADEGHTVTADSLANIVAMNVEDLLAYDVVWVNPTIGPIIGGNQPYYDNLIAAVAADGPLERYAARGGVLVICTAGNSGSQTNIAPGGVDYDRSTSHDAETLTSPTHPYLTGAGYGGAVLVQSTFNNWATTDLGQLTGLPAGTTTVLSNTDGPSLVEYPWGCGQVIVTTLIYGWKSPPDPSSGPAAQNLINYANVIDTAGDADGDGVCDDVDVCPGFDDAVDEDNDGVSDGCDQCLGFDDAIDSDGDGIPDGCDTASVHNLTQNSDFFTLQAAIDAATNGDEIEADPGTYLESIDFEGKAITLRSTSGDPNDTIIDGTGHYHAVQCISGEEPNTLLSGFTLTGGNADGDPFETSATSGGGMYIELSSPTVDNCIFRDNFVSGVGGGLLAYASGFAGNGNSSTVNGCIFQNNTSDQGGGGIGCLYGDLTMNHCVVRNNTGGGMWCSESNFTANNCVFDHHTDGGLFLAKGTLTATACIFRENDNGGLTQTEGTITAANCVFSGNHANVGGAMQGYSGCEWFLTNCVFSGNHADYGGGALYWSYGSVFATNCAFSGNTAPSEGSAMYCQDATLRLANSIVWDNNGGATYDVSCPGTAFYSLTQDNLSPWLNDGGGNISGGQGDPLFVDADGADDIAGTADDNLRLQPGSPCIDAGNSMLASAFPFDLNGYQRITDDPATADTGIGFPDVVDMGAYEFSSLPPPCTPQIEGDVNCDGVVNIFDFILMSGNWLAGA